MVLMTNDVEHFSYVFLVIWIFFLVKCLFEFFVHLKNWVFIYFKFICRTYLHLLLGVLCNIYNLRDRYTH